MTTTAPNTLELLAREVGRITGAGNAPTDVSLSELGVDSLNIIEMIVFCEQLYGVFDPEKIELSAFTTLADLDRQLHSLTTAAAA
ncbi:phosphopantetheine-binding protein [Tahibacter amnicola]|uniref:Acyl carrier protein n=1 Tax=Tahibacter amnicola TaxID=2976241 RepID=A0ABY6B7W5_9GAMM|nr:acyl carrier protein [Tahibacter amnicola]UXI66183.1 acyl carrier protein [Tahibacter amnicola]